MSNNSSREIGIYKAIKSAPDYILEILSVLEENFREFNITVKYQDNSTTINIQDKETKVHGDPLRIVTLDIFSNPKSYVMNLYRQTNNKKNRDHVYKIKVKGNYDLKRLKNNLEKLIRGKNLTHYPNFYPF